MKMIEEIGFDFMQIEVKMQKFQLAFYEICILKNNWQSNLRQVYPTNSCGIAQNILKNLITVFSKTI